MLLCSSGMQRWLCGSRKKKKREEQYIDNNAVKTAPQGKMEPWFRRFSMNRNKTDLIVGHVCRYLYSKPDTQSESDLKGHSSDGWSTTFRLFVVDAVSYDAAFCTTCVNLWKRRSWILVILLFRHFSVYFWCRRDVAIDQILRYGNKKNGTVMTGCGERDGGWCAARCRWSDTNSGPLQRGQGLWTSGWSSTTDCSH